MQRVHSGKKSERNLGERIVIIVTCPAMRLAGDNLRIRRCNAKCTNDMR